MHAGKTSATSVSASSASGGNRRHSEANKKFYDGGNELWEKESNKIFEPEDKYLPPTSRSNIMEKKKTITEIEEKMEEIEANGGRVIKRVVLRDINKSNKTKNDNFNVENRRIVKNKGGTRRKTNKKEGLISSSSSSYDEDELREEILEREDFLAFNNSKTEKHINENEREDKFVEKNVRYENGAAGCALHTKSASSIKLSNCSISHRGFSSLNNSNKINDYHSIPSSNSFYCVPSFTDDYFNKTLEYNSNNINNFISDSHFNKNNINSINTNAIIDTKRKASTVSFLNSIHNYLQNELSDKDEYDIEIECMYTSDKKSVFTVRDIVKYHKDNAHNLMHYRKMYFKSAFKTSKGGKKNAIFSCKSGGASMSNSQCNDLHKNSTSMVIAHHSHLHTNADSCSKNDVNNTPIILNINANALPSPPPSFTSAIISNSNLCVSSNSLCKNQNVNNDINTVNNNSVNINANNNATNCPVNNNNAEVYITGSTPAPMQYQISGVSTLDNNSSNLTVSGKRKREKDVAKQAKRSIVGSHLSSSPLPSSINISIASANQNQVSPTAAFTKSSSQPSGRHHHASSSPPTSLDLPSFFSLPSPTITRSSARLQQIAQSQSNFSGRDMITNMQQQTAASSSTLGHGINSASVMQKDVIYTQNNNVDDIYASFDSINRLPYISSAAMSVPIIRERRKIAVRKLWKVEQYLQMCEDMYFGCFNRWNSEVGGGAGGENILNGNNTNSFKYNQNVIFNNSAEHIMHALITSNNKNIANTFLSSASGSSSYAPNSSSSFPLSFPSSSSLPSISSFSSLNSNNNNNNNAQLMKITPLELLTSPLRKPHVLDLWGPKETALFEAAICKYGKDFNKIQRIIQTKNTKEIVDLYYLWKKTSRYKAWKEFRKYSNTIMHPVFG